MATATSEGGYIQPLPCPCGRGQPEYYGNTLFGHPEYGAEVLYCLVNCGVRAIDRSPAPRNRQPGGLPIALVNGWNNRCRPPQKDGAYGL